MAPPSGLTHREVLKSLTTEQKRALTKLSDTRGLRHLAGHVAVIIACGWLNATSSGYVQFVAMLGQGVTMVFLFTAMHECSHGTAFRTRWINRLVSNLVGFLLFLLPRWFFYFHQDHHKFTQDPLRDPELASPKPQTKWGYIWHVTGVPVWRDHITALLSIALTRRDDPYVPQLAKPAVRRQAWVYLALYAFIIPLLWIGDALVQYWLLPLILGQPFLRLYLLAEHADCAENDNMLVNTRTVLTTPVVRFFAWNMPYHIEHHSFTAVPFHRLPDLHRILQANLGVTENGYVRFNRNFVKGLN